MTKLTFTQENAVELRIKIDGEFHTLSVDPSKMHESWLARCFEYGVRRLVNDTNSGAKGSDKLDGCKLTIKEMTNGEALPVKVSRGVSASVDPVLALATKNAKAALTAVFKQVTGESKAIDFAQHTKVKPFFNVAEDRATWVEVTVQAWMAKQAADGKTDYVADAKAVLDGADDAAADLDF